MLEKRALFILSVLIPGCLGNTVALEPEATKVTLVREGERPLHCKSLGKISGTSRASDEKAARAGAENDFRNQAAKLKGNFALLEAERGGPVGTSSERSFFIGGKALHCETEAMQEAADAAEAKEQAQKEQEQEQDEREQQETKEHDSEQPAAKKGKK